MNNRTPPLPALACGPCLGWPLPCVLGQYGVVNPVKQGINFMAEVVGSPAPLRIPPPPPESPLESPPPAQKVAGGGGGSDAPQSSQAVASPPSLKNPTTGSAWMWGRTRYHPPARATGGEGGAFLLGLSDTLAPYSCAFLSPHTTYYFIFDLHSDTEDTRPVLVSDRPVRPPHHRPGGSAGAHGFSALLCAHRVGEGALYAQGMGHDKDGGG